MHQAPMALRAALTAASTPACVGIGPCGAWMPGPGRCEAARSRRCRRPRAQARFAGQASRRRCGSQARNWRCGSRGCHAATHGCCRCRRQQQRRWRRRRRSPSCCCAAGWLLRLQTRHPPCSAPADRRSPHAQRPPLQQQRSAWPPRGCPRGQTGGQGGLGCRCCCAAGQRRSAGWPAPHPASTALHAGRTAAPGWTAGRLPAAASGMSAAAAAALHQLLGLLRPARRAATSGDAGWLVGFLAGCLPPQRQRHCGFAHGDRGWQQTVLLPLLPPPQLLMCLLLLAVLHLG